jgi:hypothetical protein
MARKELRAMLQSRFAAASGSGGNDSAMMAVIWILLVAVAVAGRLWQPALNVTPMAAVGLAAGAIFTHPLVALSVPLAALAASNLFLPAYGSFAMALIVFAATAWPAVLGFFVPRIRQGAAWAWLGGALAHSLVFFVVTNTAYWWTTDDYPRSFAGLAECFTMALPFYRWMPVGDAAWSLGTLGCLGMAAGAVRLTGGARTAE